MTYVYVRKDLSHIEEPQEQTLLKAFLTALYDPAYIDQCVEKFAFTAVPDNVRQIGLDGIDMLGTAANATEWFFESSTTPGDGQGNFVISDKRRSYGEYQRYELDANTIHLQDEVADLREQLSNERARIGQVTDELGTIREQMGGDANTPITSSAQYADFTQDDAGQITAALAMSAVSIVLWAVAIAFLAIQKFHVPNKDVTVASPGVETQNGAISGGSGHAARTAAKHSAVTQESDMVA